MSAYRYPGAKPFEIGDKDIFYGRSTDIRQMTDLVLLEKMVLLYAKSGLGKSSLINAGVIPLLYEESNFQPLNLRFYAYKPEAFNTPLQVLENAIKKRAEKQTTVASPLSELLMQTSVNDSSLPTSSKVNSPSLWNQFKALQVDGGMPLVLFFDQLEELFTYPSEHILAFKKELAELLFTKMPQNLRDKLRQQPNLLTDEQLNLLYQPIEIRVCFIIRSDRMSLLNQLRDYIPNVLRTFYELKPLTEVQAIEAILKPAEKQGDFLTPNFGFDKLSLQKIIAYLTEGGKQSIETFQLQILLNYIETEIVEKKEDSQIEPDDLGNLEDIFLNYYESQIRKLPQEVRYEACRFIEEQLIQEERRISLDKIVCLKYIREDALIQLVNAHLIRLEPNTTGGFSYELAHDTLIAPILKAKEIRINKEQKIAEQKRIKEEAEKRAAELLITKRKAQKQRNVIVGVSIIAIIAVIAAILAITKTIEANRQINNIFTMLIDKSYSYINIYANYNDSESTEYQAAKTNIESTLQDVYELDIERQKLAEAYMAMAEIDILLSSSDSIAFKRASDVENLQAPDSILANGYIEMAFFAYLRKTSILQKIKREEDVSQSDLLFANKNIVPICIEKALRYKNTQSDLLYTGLMRAVRHAYLSGEDSSATYFLNIAKQLQSNYKLDTLMTDKTEMVKIKGGTFEMGSSEGNADEQPIHSVTLSDFQMSKYEITAHQYCLFLNDIKSKIKLQKVADLDHSGDVLWQLNDTTSWFREYSVFYDSIQQKFLPKSGFKARPMNCITWYGAKAYCEWAKGRLPTEAEWEYAANGGKEKSVYSYAGSHFVHSVAWFKGNAQKLGNETQIVGTRQPNVFGLYDMSGNVREWCEDWYDEKFYGKVPNTKDPLNKNKNITKVSRGGSWVNINNDCRITDRSGNDPNIRISNYGFRLVSLSK